MSHTAVPPSVIPTAAHVNRQAVLSLLGDTFAIHEVGHRLATSELLMALDQLGNGPLAQQVTVLVSAQEIIERFGLVWPADGRVSVTTVLPAVDSAAYTLQEALFPDALGWGHCRFRAGLLEREGREAPGAGEVRVLVSPEGGLLTDPRNGSAVPPGAVHIVSEVLADAATWVPVERVAPILRERSLSEDLIATCGLAELVQRHPALVRELSEHTMRQLHAEFPMLEQAALMSH